MSSLIKNIRLWLTLSFFGVIVLFHSYIIALSSVPKFESQPVVLITGNFSDTDDFCHAVYTGVEKGQQAMESRGLKNVALKKLDTRGGVNYSDLRNKFLALLAQEHVLAVISADNSQVAQTVISLCSPFRIPVFLTVATNDGLLSGSEGNTLRLIARDSKQAEAIAEWCGRYKRPAVIYDDSKYGEFLGQRVVASLIHSNADYYTSQITRTTDIHPILLNAVSARCDAFVLIGYYSRVPEFFSKMRTLTNQPPVLLSDGCYFQNLRSVIKTNAVTLCFPTNPKAGNMSDVKGYGQFGYDAYLMLAQIVRYMEAEHLATIKLCSTLRDRLRTKAIEGLGLQYSFTDSGENKNASFELLDQSKESLSQ